MISFSIYVSIYIAACSIHVLGLWLLIRKPRFFSKHQRYYFITLSISEIILSIDHLIMEILSYQQHKLPKWSIILQVYHYYGAWITNLMTLVFITLDRFAEVYYNLQYQLYLTKTRTLCIVAFIWLFGILFSILILLLYYEYNFEYLEFSYTYIYPVTDTIVVLNGICVYSYIYKKCLRNRKLSEVPVATRNALAVSLHNIKTKPKYALRKRTFFVPSLIVFTFTLFVYIPDATYFIKFIVYHDRLDWLAKASTIFYSVGFISDAAIYIFLRRELRQLFRRTAGGNRTTTFAETTELPMK